MYLPQDQVASAGPQTWVLQVDWTFLFSSAWICRIIVCRKWIMLKSGIAFQSHTRRRPMKLLMQHLLFRVWAGRPWPYCNKSASIVFLETCGQWFWKLTYLNIIAQWQVKDIWSMWEFSSVTLHFMFGSESCMLKLVKILMYEIHVIGWSVSMFSPCVWVVVWDQSGTHASFPKMRWFLAFVNPL